MSWSAIFGLLGLNVWFALIGLAVVFAVRGWRTWSEVGRLLGVAYMAGVAASGAAVSWQLMLGIDLSRASIFVVGIVLIVVAAATGLLLGRTLPGRPVWRRPATRASIVSGLLAGLVVVYMEVQFRAGRLAGLYEFDAWSFWVPKAKAIYYFGGLDGQFFRELAGPSYPPLIPALEAEAFHFMGRPDEVTLHLQFWFFLLGFVAALVGLLSNRVSAPIVWLSVLLVLVTPHVVDHALEPQGDFLLGEFFALGAVLMGGWLIDDRPWQLWLSGFFLLAATMTKREGIVLVACVLAAGFVATRHERRFAWRRLALVGAAAAAALVPWRVFLLVHSLPGGGPEAGGTGLLSNSERAWPSFRLALSTLFDFDIWLISIPLLLISVAFAAVYGRRQLATFVLTLSVLCVAAFTWSTWAFPSLPITKAAALNPIVRFSGALVLAAAGLIPLLLEPRRRR